MVSALTEFGLDPYDINRYRLVEVSLEKGGNFNTIRGARYYANRSSVRRSSKSYLPSEKKRSSIESSSIVKLPSTSLISHAIYKETTLCCLLLLMHLARISNSGSI